MVFLGIVIALIAFYVLVQRRHKILLGQMVLGFIGLSIAIVMSILGWVEYKKYSDRKQQEIMNGVIVARVLGIITTTEIEAFRRAGYKGKKPDSRLKRVAKYLHKELKQKVSHYGWDANDIAEKLKEKERIVFSGLMTGDKTRPEIHVEICNKKSEPLLSYELHIIGYEKNRSTPYPISPKLKTQTYTNVNGESVNATQLTGDIIIPGNTCSIMIWPGEYANFFGYDIPYRKGKWHLKSSQSMSQVR